MTKEKLIERWSLLECQLECRKSKEARFQLKHVRHHLSRIKGEYDIEHEKSYIISSLNVMQNAKHNEKLPQINREAADHGINILAALLALYQELPDENDTCKPF